MDAVTPSFPLALPPDPFWLLRVHVANAGDPIPYPVWLAWAHQFTTPKGLPQ